MNVAQQCRRKIQTARRQGYGRLPTSRAFRDTLIDQPLDALELYAGDDGTDVDGFVERRTDSQSVHAVLNLTDQFIRDALLHQQSRTSATNLPLVEPDAVDQPLHGAIQVGIFKNNERRFSAKFERKLFVALRCSFANGAAHFRRTGEGNLVDVGVLHERFACRTVAGNDVDDTSGEPRLLTDLREGESCQRRKFRGLQHDGIPGGERGGNLPCQHEQREIPRNDLTYNAARGVSGKFLLEQLRPARMVIEMARHQRNIDVAALTNRLAVVESFENREPARMLLHLPRHRIEVARTRMRTEGLPRSQSTPRGFHRAVYIRCRSFCDGC